MRAWVAHASTQSSAAVVVRARARAIVLLMHAACVCAAALVAYGAAGSGKTHTLLGDGAGELGLLAHCTGDLFRRQRAGAEVRVSVLELRGDTLVDLLNPSAGPLDALVSEAVEPALWVGRVERAPLGGTKHVAASAPVVASVDDVVALVVLGEQQRVLASSDAGGASSSARADAHTIVRVQVRVDATPDAPCELVRSCARAALRGV